MTKDATLGTAIRDYCYSAAHEFNRNYVVTVLTKDALDRHYGIFKKKERPNVKVLFPSHKGGITEEKTNRALIGKLLQQSLDFDIYKNSLITAVSVAEDLLSNILRAVLERFPERPKCLRGWGKIG